MNDGKKAAAEANYSMGTHMRILELMAMASVLGLLSVSGSSAEQDKTPVIVELFTSEGCSSCPPADLLLQRLDDMQPFPGVEVIALSQHVDYWNRLGWTDPYSSSLFSARQAWYAKAFRGNGSYTPQMVVDGAQEFVGSDEGRASAAIRTAAKKQKVNVSLACRMEGSDRLLSVKTGIVKDAQPKVLLAITEDGLSQNVTRGENEGRKLSHRAVTRKLEPLGDAGPIGFSKDVKLAIDKSWRPDKLNAVVFLQEAESRRIVGAAKLRLQCDGK